MSSIRQKINDTFLQKKRSHIKSKEIDNNKEDPIINIKLGSWNDEENNKLRQWVKKNGAFNWTKCADYMKNRTAKQCREHWKNSLDSNLKVGQWTSEEDLLIMKFYKKYESWRKMIPIFEGRTENSIKNRFFSQLRKIAVKRRPTGRKEYGTKYGLEILKNFLEEGIKQAEKKYFDENKNMTKESFENYMIQIENSIKNRKKGKKFIDISAIKNKNSNFKNHRSKSININEDEEEKKSIEDELKEENLETFNNNNKPKKRKKKSFKNNIFKTTKDIEQLNTIEETINQKEIINFTKKNSKSKIISNKTTDEEKTGKEILNNENNKNNENNNNIINRKISKKISRKLSKKLEEEQKDDFIFVHPKYNDYTIDTENLAYNNNNDYQRSESIDIGEKEDINKEKLGNRTRYNYKTSLNIDNIKKGENIFPFMSFSQP